MNLLKSAETQWGHITATGCPAGVWLGPQAHRRWPSLVSAAWDEEAHCRSWRTWAERPRVGCPEAALQEGEAGGRAQGALPTPWLQQGLQAV